MLPSGLLVLLEQDMDATSAGVVSVVQGGSAEDPPGAEGLAHLVEHLTFRATDPPSVVPLPLAAAAAASDAPARISRWEQLVRFGAGESNAFTTPDAVTFEEFGPESRLAWLVELEGRRLADPLAGVDEAALALEQHIVSNEHDLRRDPRAGASIVEDARQRIFPGEHPYARPVAGSEESRRHLTLAGARAFVAKVFRPERMTLLVSAPAASTNIEEIIGRLPKALVGDPLTPVKRAPLPDEASTIPDAPAGEIQRLVSALPTSQLLIGWSLPNGFGPEVAKDTLLASWAAEDLDLDALHRLDPHIRGATAFLDGGLRASVLFVRVMLEEGADADHAARVVTEHLASLWTRQADERGILSRMKATILAELYVGEPAQMARAFQQAQIAALNAKPTRRDNLLAAVGGLDDQTVADFARERLTVAHAHVVLFTPAPADPPRAERDRRAARAPRLSTPASEDLIAHASSWDELELPGVSRPVRALRVETLPSGLTLVVARRPAAGAVAWLGFHGGYADADPALLVDVAMRTRPEAMDSARIGVLAGRGAGRDASLETVEFRPAQLEAALALLFAKATIPVRQWPPQEKLARLVANLTSNTDEASAKADRAFWSQLFGPTPLARTVDKADLPKVTRAATDAWISRVNDVRNGVLVVVGDVSFDDVRRLVAAPPRVAAAATAPLPDLAAPELRPASESHLTPVITQRPGRLVEVRIGCLLPKVEPATRHHYELLRLAIQARLNSALRIARGEGYGVDVQYDWLRGGTSYLQIVSSFDADSLEDSLATVRTAWLRWSEAGFDAGELNLARWRYAGELTLGADIHAIAFHLFNDWNTGLLPLGERSFEVDLNALGAEDVDPLFAACKANAVLGLTGDEATARAALSRAWPEAARQAL